MTDSTRGSAADAQDQPEPAVGGQAAAQAATVGAVPVQDRADAGYSRQLKPRHIQMIAIGGSIGTGLFLGAGGRLQMGGAGLMLAYAICGLFAFFMVRALGELAVRRPSSGAFVSYSREFLGEKAAYVTGWLFFLDWAASAMADITAVAAYMHFWTLFQPVPQWLIALVALLLVFILNLMSVKMYGEAEFWFAIIKVATILAFMAIAIWAIVTGAPVGGHNLHGAAATYQAGLGNILDFGGFFPQGIAPVFALTLGVIFAFGGTEMVGVAAGETKEAATILPKAINSMIVRIFFFYVGSVILMALVLPYFSYSANQSPFVTFFSGIGIPHAGDVIQVVVLTAALSSLNAGLYATGRTLRSMAIAGSGPKIAAKMNKNHVPYAGIAITAGLGIFGVILNAVLPSEAFTIVMDLSGIGIAGTWAFIVLAHLAFLRRVKQGKESRPAFKMPGAPYTNYLSLAFFLIVVLSNLTSADGRWTLLLFVIVVVAMVGGWFAVRGRINGNLLDSMLDADAAEAKATIPAGAGSVTVQAGAAAEADSVVPAAAGSATTQAGESAPAGPTAQEG